MSKTQSSNAVNGSYQQINLFTEENTPLHFRSILAQTTHDDFSSPTFFDSPFYVAGIFQDESGPASKTYIPLNQFYLRKTTEFAKFMGWTGIIVLLFAIAAWERAGNNL